MLEYKQFPNNNHHRHMRTYTDNKIVISQKFPKTGNTVSSYPGHTYQFQTRLGVRRQHLCSKQFLISSFLDQTLNLYSYDLYSAFMMCLILLHKNILQ